MGRKEELGEKIAKEFEHWKDVYKNGCGDPFWEDGTNLNLIRNHILIAKRECEKELQPDDFPEQYHWETPKQVDNKYMARKKEIKANAQKALAVYEQDPDYLWLKEHIGRMSEQQIKETLIRNVVNYPEALRFFIDTGRYVDMRRHEKPERYIDAFKRCRERVEPIFAGKPQIVMVKETAPVEEVEMPEGQLTLFDMGFM